MKAKSKCNIWFWVLLCVPCLLTSCEHEVHDGKEEGGLSVSLTWQDKTDQGTEVKDVKLQIRRAAEFLQNSFPGGAEVVLFEANLARSPALRSFLIEKSMDAE